MPEYLYIIQLHIIALGILLTAQHFAIAKASSFMERFSSAAFVGMRDEIEPFLTKIRLFSREKKIAECLVICKREGDNAKLFNKLHALGMFFGEIGVSFKRGTIDSNGLRIFNRILPYYWDELEPFIIACHMEFKFPIDLSESLSKQPLVFFDTFRYANDIMDRKGISVRPGKPARKPWWEMDTPLEQMKREDGAASVATKEI